MELYYYNDEVVDLDRPGEMERMLVREGDLLIRQGIYYFRMEGLKDIIRYMIGCQGIVRVPPERIPRAWAVRRRI